MSFSCKLFLHKATSHMFTGMTTMAGVGGGVGWGWGRARAPTEGPSSLSTVETSFLSQWTKSDVQTSRTIHINEKKSTNENNESIPVQCQPGPDYPFPMKQFGKKKRLLAQKLFLVSLFQRKGLSFLYILHKV